MRPKLVPNYKFDPHLEASRLRDNEGDGTLWTCFSVEPYRINFCVVYWSASCMLYDCLERQKRHKFDILNDGHFICQPSLMQNK